MLISLSCGEAGSRRLLREGQRKVGADGIAKQRHTLHGAAAGTGPCRLKRLFRADTISDDILVRIRVDVIAMVTCSCKVRVRIVFAEEEELEQQNGIFADRSFAFLAAAEVFEVERRQELLSVAILVRDEPG